MHHSAANDFSVPRGRKRAQGDVKAMTEKEREEKTLIYFSVYLPFKNNAKN